MSRILTIGGYGVLAIAMVVLLVLGHRRRSSIAPFGELVDVILIDRTTRLAIMLCWWWLGWHFLVGQTV